MLLQDKIQQTAFSPAEEGVVQYILKEGKAIQSLTIQQIAEANFVHPSTLIRIAKKLGFSGWVELKSSFLEEVAYLQSHFAHVDANLPFTYNDGFLTIAKKMAHLEQTTIEDTLSLLQNSELKKAAEMLVSADQIKIFGSNANSLIAKDFVLKMRRIQKDVHVVDTLGEQIYEASDNTRKVCAILISYTGENSLMSQVAAVLKQNKQSFISVTSIGENTLANQSAVALRITTREKLYSKIGNFTINSSICYLLDVLYSCVFSLNYHKNLDHLIQLGRRYDHRISTSAVMAENKLAKPNLQYHDSILPN